MGFNKYIRSGSQLELYEYQYEINHIGRNTRSIKTISKGEGLDDSGKDTLEAERRTRRRDNASRATMAFKRLVLSNLSPTDKPLFVTCTFSENRRNIAEANRLFHIFTIRLRRTYGNSFRYIAVPEFQKRGAVHYHALFWGLPDETVVNERRDRKIAKLWGKGFVDIIETDGHEKISSYLAKYMGKAILDNRLYGKRAYMASRNVRRPITSSGFPLWWVEDEFELSTIEPLLSKDFVTQWLGQGRYKLYKLNNI